MSVNVVNPDNAALQQAEGNWMKFCAFIVWKLAPKCACGGYVSCGSYPSHWGHKEGCRHSAIPIIQRAEQAEARLAEAERDAARYRRLLEGPYPFCFEGIMCHSAEDVSRAIDATLTVSADAGGEAMTECFYNKFHPTLPQCKNEGKPLGPEYRKVGNGTDTWTWCEQHQGAFHRDPLPAETVSEAPLDMVPAPDGSRVLCVAEPADEVQR